MPKLVLATKAEAEHFARLLRAAGYTPHVDGFVVTSPAPTKAWRAVVLKFNKQRVIRAAAARGKGKLLMEQKELV